MVGSCSGYVEPLNLQCILLNNFAGSSELFTFIAMISIAMMGAKFRMINSTLLIIFGLFAVIMANFHSGFYFLAVLIAGLVAAFGVGRLGKV